MIPGKLFGKEVVIEGAVDVSRIPHSWGGKYTLTRAAIDGVPVIVVEPIDRLMLPDLAKLVEGIGPYTRRTIMVMFKELSTYQRRRLTQMEVPWVAKRAHYLPFLHWNASAPTPAPVPEPVLDSEVAHDAAQ